MRKRSAMNIMKRILLMMLFTLAVSGMASAATFNLRADVITKAMPDGAVITMWGFACDSATAPAVCPNQGVVTVPGPQLVVPSNDNTLTINLTNNLSEPVSIIIPGQQQNVTAMTPVKFTDSQGRKRVMSFTNQAAAKTGSVSGTAAYTWNNVRPGSFIYQSGTHPAVQIQMGLYGAMKKDFATGQAYNSSSSQYANEVILFYSEIDSALHSAVATGNYGPGKAVTSTTHYEPKYFLVNGEPFSAGKAPVLAGLPNQNTLIRFMNIGLSDLTPLLQGLYMNIISEDGNLLRYPRNQYSVILAAGKTIDAIITPTKSGFYPVYDRRLKLANGPSTGGGMLTYLNVNSPTNCTANVLSNFSLDLPIVNVSGTNLFADLQYVPGTTSDIMLKLTDYGTITDSGSFSGCQASTLTFDGSNFKLHVPLARYSNSGFTLDLQYVPSTDGQIWFRLTSVSSASL
ncbi:MAG: hypothetical protein HZA17_10880 [Nitrospirae bacterium]|nr:hypothetical protein [Nitrospirota bacterium]